MCVKRLRWELSHRRSSCLPASSLPLVPSPCGQRSYIEENYYTFLKIGSTVLRCLLNAEPVEVSSSILLIMYPDHTVPGME